MRTNRTTRPAPSTPAPIGPETPVLELNEDDARALQTLHARIMTLEAVLFPIAARAREDESGFGADALEIRSIALISADLEEAYYSKNLDTRVRDFLETCNARRHIYPAKQLRAAEAKA